MKTVADMKRCGFVSLCGLMLSMLAGCQHKELCLDHDSHNASWYADIVTTYDYKWEYYEEGSPTVQWESNWPERFGISYNSLAPSKPSGVKVLEYSDKMGNRVSNIPPDGGRVGFTASAYAMLLYNNDTEYILFENLNEPATTRATTRKRTRSSYLGNSLNKNKNDEITVNQPDALYCSFLRKISKQSSQEVYEMPMVPVTYTYLIRCTFEKGAQHLRLGRGALAGMASGVYLYDGSTSNDPVTVLFDGTVKPWGVEAIVHTFGVPGYPAIYTGLTRGVLCYLLNIEVRLSNGDYKTFEVDVTEQVENQPRGGVIEVSGLVITDEEAQGKGSGFDVNVNDWGEYEEVPMPL